MKLTRLLLTRYGHLTDIELSFPADRRLHVVLGANEAGKSTALAAIGDALYGFPLRTPYAYLHEQSDLRVGFELAAADGALHSFIRLKRRKDNLTDGDGRPVPESALSAVRGPQDRTFFEDMFGLNGVRLRQGGNAMLEGRGEAGTTIFQASSGLTQVPAALVWLERQADALYSPRRVASRAFYQALASHETARIDLDARTLRGDDYEARRDERAKLATTITLNTARERTLAAERRRLERIRRTLPALDGHAAATASLAALGPVPALPADAQARMQDAILKRDVAAQTLARDTASRAEIAMAHAALAPDAAVLREAAAIDALAREQPGIDKTIGDRTAQQIAAAAHAAAIERLGRDLGLSGDADAIVARMPTAVARAALRRAANEHKALAARRSLMLEQDGAARLAAVAAAAHLAACPAAPDAAPLARAIAAARAEGRIDEDCRRNETAFADAVAEAAQALAALPLWSGNAAALRAAPVPVAAEVRRHETALTAAGSTLRDAVADGARTQRELDAAEHQLLALTAGAALPTGDAIATARDLRDRAWRLLRRTLIDGGPPPSEAERHGLPSAPLGDALEQLTRDADRIADRRNAEAKRISDYEHALGSRATCAAVRRRAAAGEAAARAERDAAVTAWQAAWTPAGLTPLDPPGMRDWLTSRTEVLAALEREAAARRRLEDANARRAAARAALAVHLPPDNDPRLAALLAAAETAAAGQTAAIATRADAEKQHAQTRKATEDAARALAKVEAEMAAWGDGWAGRLADLALPPGTSAEDAEAPLALWESIAAAAQARDAARARVADMTGAIAAFAAQAGQLAGRAAPELAGSELAGSEAGAVVAELAVRLRAARDVQAEKDRKAAERDKLDAGIAQAQAAHGAGEQVLVAFRHLAGAATDGELAAAIVRAGQHGALVADITTHAATLQRQGEGLPLATLQAEAAGQELDALAARVDEIGHDLDGLTEISNAARQRAGQLDADLERMAAGQNAAEAAQRVEDHAAEAAGIAARYARIRLAGALLRAGLDRYRQQQQDPLLRRAGSHFAKLTDGRYARLEVVENDDGAQAIVALTGTGQRCPVNSLSEGTRDQLYLALRLAAIEDYAERAPSLPLIADDLLVQFDDARARAAIAVLAEAATRMQVILFTHHAHVAAMITPALGDVQTL